MRSCSRDGTVCWSLRWEGMQNLHTSCDEATSDSSDTAIMFFLEYIINDKRTNIG